MAKEHNQAIRKIDSVVLARGLKSCKVRFRHGPIFPGMGDPLDNIISKTLSGSLLNPVERDMLVDSYIEMMYVEPRLADVLM